MKKIGVMLLLAVSVTSCMTTSYDIGRGAQSNVSVKKKEVYLLWGLVPINSVDVQKMSKGNKDYTVKTEVNFVDFLISIPGRFISLRTQTVKVTH